MSVAAAPSQPTIHLGPLVGGFAHIALAFWWFWVALAAIALGKEAVRRLQRRRLSRSGIGEVDAMDGRTFEVFLSTVFERLGYRAQVTKYRGDYGADLVVERDGVRTVVQAKCWRKSVGPKAVQEAVTAKAMYDCSKALVVANRYFTNHARTLARANGVELWDRDVLVSKLLAHEEATTAASLAPVGGDSCTVCGVHVTPKVRQWCLDRPEKFGGRVYCFVHQRSVSGPDPKPTAA